MRLTVPASVWTDSTCVHSACSTNFTVRLIVYRNANLFPVRRTDRDVISDVITVAIGQFLLLCTLSALLKQMYGPDEPKREVPRVVVLICELLTRKLCCRRKTVTWCIFEPTTWLMDVDCYYVYFTGTA